MSEFLASHLRIPPSLPYLLHRQSIPRVELQHPSQQVQGTCVPVGEEDVHGRGRGGREGEEEPGGGREGGREGGRKGGCERVLRSGMRTCMGVEGVGGRERNLGERTEEGRGDR